MLNFVNNLYHFGIINEINKKKMFLHYYITEFFILL